MTNLFFGLKQNSLNVQTFRDGVLVEEVKASQNGSAPNAGQVTIYALDSADSGRNAAFVDRTWVDQGEGIGIADGGDGNTSTRKRIDGDEVLGLDFGDFKSKKAEITLDRVASTDGAQIRVKAFKNGIEVDSQVITVSGDGRQSIDFSSLSAFDEIQISAADADTQFAFRSINLEEAKPEILSLRQQPNNLDMQVLLNGVVIEEARGTQNGAVPNVGPFAISALNSPDTGNVANFVDVTFLDQGEGIGIKDGNDRNTATQKRIDGDEILGVSFTQYLVKDALINVDRIKSTDGAEIKIEAFKGGSSVGFEVFSLGTGDISASSLDFGSANAFDTLQISAADKDTTFTFRGVDLVDPFAV